MPVPAHIMIRPDSWSTSSPPSKGATPRKSWTSLKKIVLGTFSYVRWGYV